MKNKLRGLALTVNNKCNISCSYCYMETANKKFQEDYDSKATEFIRDLCMKAEKENVEFEYIKILSAEPTILSPVVLANCINELSYVTDTVEIVTNGVNFGDPEYFSEFYGELRNSNVVIGVSADGHKELHDKHRDRSYNSVYKGIINLLSVGLLNTLSTVVTPHTIKDSARFLEWVKEMQALGVPNIIFAKEETDRIMSIPEKIEIADMIRTAEDTFNADTKFTLNYTPDDVYDCRCIHISKDGNVYKCTALGTPKDAYANIYSKSFTEIQEIRYSSEAMGNTPVNSECYTCTEYDKCHMVGCFILRTPDGYSYDCMKEH